MKLVKLLGLLIAFTLIAGDDASVGRRRRKRGNKARKGELHTNVVSESPGIL